MRNERTSIGASGFARGERGEVGGRSGRALRFFSPVEGGAPLDDSADGAGFGDVNRIGGGVRDPEGGGGGGAANGALDGWGCGGGGGKSWAADALCRVERRARGVRADMVCEARRRNKSTSVQCSTSTGSD